MNTNIRTAALISIAFTASSVFAAQTATPAPGSKTQATTPAKSAQTPSKPASTPALTPKTPANTPKVAATVPPTETVITIAGLCPANTPPANCGTKISRADFEKLLNVVNPNLPAEARREVAAAYVQLLTAANEGQKLGVDKDPEYQEKLRLETLKLLAGGAQKKVLESSKPSHQDVENFYTENASKFEELSLRRIIIPKNADPKAAEKDAKPEQAKELADKIHDRAVAGEDPDKLQAEAFLAVKAPGAPPSTSLGWKRRGSMDPRHEPQIVALRSGQVSSVFDDAQAFYIYKVDSKRMVPLQAVAKDIESALQSQRAQQSFKQLLENVKPQLNEAYFGPEPPKQEAPAQQPSPK